MNIVEVGVRVLFLPAIIIISLITLGLILFIIERLISLMIRIPAAAINRSLQESDQQKTKLSKEKPLKNILNAHQLKLSIKSGGWIVWVATIPLSIAIFYVLLILLSKLITLSSFFTLE